MDNIGQIKAIFLEYKLITVADFDKINISFDNKNVYISGVKLKNDNFAETEKRLERKIIFNNIQNTVVERKKLEEELKWAKKHYKKGFKKLLVAPHKHTDYPKIKEDQEKIHLFMRTDYFTK